MCSIRPPTWNQVHSLCPVLFFFPPLPSCCRGAVKVKNGWAGVESTLHRVFYFVINGERKDFLLWMKSWKWAGEGHAPRTHEGEHVGARRHRITGKGQRRSKRWRDAERTRGERERARERERYERLGLHWLKESTAVRMRRKRRDESSDQKATVAL